MNRKNLVRAGGALTAAAALTLALGACSAKAYASQCAVIVGNGVGDSRDVKDVLLPGEKVSKGDDEDWYLPCNARNFVITSDTDHGDRHTAVIAKTGPSEDGKTPATPVKVWLSSYWTPNETKPVLTQFYNRLCRKYSCASAEPQDEASSSNFTPSEGWNGMLREVYGPAVDRTGTTVLAKFPPNVWNTPSSWNGKSSVAEAFQNAFAPELRQSMQSGADNYFCGSSDGTKQGDCTPITFSVEKIEPVDPAIVTIYNQSVVTDQRAAQARNQTAANAARLAAAKALYGSQAEGALREQDAIAACAENKVTCVINLGGGSLAAPVPAR